jgi:ATP-dependent Zn protease
MNKELYAALIEWFPMLLLIGVWLFFMRQMQVNGKTKSGKTSVQISEEHVVELRRQNDLLEKIIKDQDARLQSLERSRNSI